jgi:hypothetical protein
MCNDIKPEKFYMECDECGILKTDLDKEDIKSIKFVCASCESNIHIRKQKNL